MTETSDVIAVGLIVADFVGAPIPVFPEAGTLATTASITPSIGGCSANTSADLAKLGVSVSLVGRVGDDFFGDFVCRSLESAGVNCQHIARSTTQQTAATLVVNVQGEDRRFIHAVGANTELTGAEVSDELLDQAKVICVGGFGLNPALSGEQVRQRFQRAREHNVVTMLDVVLDDPEECLRMAKTALPETDFFLPNSDEARLMTGIKDAHDQADYFLELGAKNVVITCGELGAILKSQDGTSIERPAFQVTQVDGTGGGDAFVAGFIYGLLKGVSLAACLKYGSAMGASCVRAAGATTGVFNAADLEAFVAREPD